MKRKVELDEDELKALIARAVGMAGGEVELHVTERRDCHDRPMGGHCVTCEVTADVKPSKFYPPDEK